ncbi:hypothetical protein M9Y10_041551 [Tritrichomonas musculus]|uniref:Uncharacterized protein n=1 Tax=Tritrichomonas musculus TaxID=1915356 RepID=A0ABR2K4P6_9EUKA
MFQISNTGDGSSESSDVDILNFGQMPKVESVPNNKKLGGLSHTKIQAIISQKEQYFNYRREQDTRIWGDDNFRPGPLLDKIADHITENLVKKTSSLLESTCDSFIDCLVQSEFYPDEPFEE